ncbi:uncharacterized protein LOC128271871 isoform X3 [Anopheles cruzii]|uniref:uncharacterized protein LOC128271871 isoform X3 n=1 Tax=Anopheles cruzii TaxID=68878 RepID=UPI0022EC7863|nr:uncharacterized protein LOC128271871 isoform X3 [Anopheles cruzii]
MRKVWLFASALLAFLNFVKSQELARTLYSPRYDNLDIDTILGSNRLVSNYVDCLLSRKPCPPEGKDLKRILPEALRTKCARCSPIQKENALKIITRLYIDYPDQYRALRERWDPSGEYNRRFEEYLRGLQFNQIGGNGATAPAGPTTGGGNGGGNGGSIGGGGSNTVDSGNDRPVRNDLDRQPATQSSNVQPVVITATRFGQPSDNVNTLLATPPTPPPPAVAPATERPRPPAPVAQILFPTYTNSSNSDSTTTSTSTIVSGTLELTSITASGSIPPNSLTITTVISPAEGSTSTGDPTGASVIPSTVASFPAELGSVTPTRPVVTAPPPVLVNRFGEDADQARPTFAPAPVPVTTTTTTQRPTTTERQTRPVTRQTTTRNTQRTTTRFAANQPLPASPIVGLWNQLGNKIADTADAIAGMLKKTVDVLVTSHIQSHQRALRRI